MSDDVRLRRFRQNPVEAILDGINAKLPAAGTPLPVEVSGAAINLVGDVTIGEVTVDNAASNPVPVTVTDATVSIDDGGASITVDGPLTDGQLRAEPVAVSLATVPLPSGAATAANQSSANTSLAAINTKTPALVSGRVPVDGSGVTQPVSDGGGSLSVDDGGGSITVDGPLTNTELRAAAVPISDGDGSITVDGAVSISGAVTTAVAARAPTTTSIAGTASSTLILAANSNRRGFCISNISTSKLYLSFSTPAAVVNSFIEMQPGSFLLFDQQLFVTNAIYGVWTNANGTAQVTEFV